MNAMAEDCCVLVLICEEALESLLGRELLECGAQGYTVCTVSGRGYRGVRDARMGLSANVRFEIICTLTTADCIIARVRERYARHFGIVAYRLNAQVPEWVVGLGPADASQQRK